VRAALEPGGEIDLLQAIARLEGSGVVGRLPNPGAFSFRVPLFADVARGTLLHQEQSDLHHRLGAWLERTDPTNLGALAHHFGLGPDDERASYHVQRLGDRQWTLGETDAALRSYQEALARLERLPSAAASARVSLRVSIARALAGLGFPAQAIETLEQARPLATAGPARSDVIRREAEIWSAAGDVDEALGVLARAENELTSLPQIEDVADTLVALAALHASAATILDRAERWADVCRSGEQALEMLTLASRPILTPGEGAIVLGVHLAMGRALTELGELSRAAEHVQAAGALADDLGDLAAEVRARILAGHLRSFHGELAAAREDYAAARALARRLADRQGEALACQHLAELAAAFDDLREAAALYRLARQIYAESGDAREANRCDQLAAALPAAVGEAHECA
jgi:tetratricopeptide (TPR) repeat protein